MEWAEENKVTPDIRATSGHLPLGLYVMCGVFDWYKWWASTDRYMAQPEDIICPSLPIGQGQPKFTFVALFLVGFLLSLGYLMSGGWGVLAVLVFYTVWLIVLAIKEKIEEAALREAALRKAALREAVLQEQEREKKLKMEAARSAYICLLSREFDDLNT